MALILKLLSGIAFGILIGNISAKWDVAWTMQIMVFGESLFKDIIQFFLPLIMITFLSLGIAELGQRAGRMLKFTLSLSYVYTVVACAVGAVVIYSTPGASPESCPAQNSLSLLRVSDNLDGPGICAGDWFDMDQG